MLSTLTMAVNTELGVLTKLIREEKEIKRVQLERKK